MPKNLRALLMLPLAVLVGFGLSFLGFQAYQRFQAPAEEPSAEATSTPEGTPSADATATPEPGPFGLPFQLPSVTLPFSLPVGATLPVSLSVSAPRLPFGDEPTPTPSPEPPPLPLSTPTPRRIAPTVTPTVMLTASRQERQYAERVGQSLVQLAAARERYATLRYTWRPGRDPGAIGAAALDLHDLARSAEAQARALEQQAPPAGLAELGQTTIAAWQGLGLSAEQYACVVLSDGQDRGCVQRANEAQSQTREAMHQASVVLARVAGPLRMPTPTATPNLSDYWAALAPRLEEMRNASDVIVVVTNAHAAGQTGNQEACRLPSYVATFREGQRLALLTPPAGWEEFHSAYVAWTSYYVEGLTSLARFCAAAQSATPTPTTQAQPRATPVPPSSPDLDQARRSFIAGNAERDRFESLLANAQARPPGSQS